ncbi:MAG TPA: PIN domain-containing protein [Longimicrobiaceae bacterium]|nr:PIN domain-containing protein [Longimicrobiaceae bacterium]
MKLLVDINIALDLLLERAPWAGDAGRLLTAIERGQAEGYVAGHTITTIYYVMARYKDRAAAATAVTDLLRILRVVPIEASDFHRALVLGLSDFEDAVQVTAGLKVGADYVVTRNGRDFKAAPVDARTPAEVLALL